MNCYNEVYLRCPQLANASRVSGNLGDDILSKITLKSGVGTIVETGSDDGHFMAVRGQVVRLHCFWITSNPRRSFKKIFSIKKPMKQAQPAPRPRGRPPGSKNAQAARAAPADELARRKK